MPNQLLIPFKSSVPVDIAAAVKQYITVHHPETHPDAFKWDIGRWDALRKDAISGGVHESKIRSLQEYHAQLTFILTKFPPDIDLDFTYQPTFSTAYTWQLRLSDLHYEQTCVLFNLASLYCQLAKAESKVSTEGIKSALRYYQLSAGTFGYILNSKLPDLQASLGTPLPADLTENFLRSMQWLMLAQAQECGWQKARADNVKNSVVAKIAAKVAQHYAAAIEAIESASPSFLNALPQEWMAHLQTKSCHFEGVAHYRQSMEELEKRRYGDEIARLMKAQELVKKAVEGSRRSRGVAAAVQNDARGLMRSIETDLKRAERDNNLIYHQDVPAPSTLQPIVGADIVRATAPPELNSSSFVKSANVTPLFTELMPYGARIAVELYEDRRLNWVNTELLDRQRELDSRARNTLQTLHLPASLEALDKSVGLPPSLLAKAAEIRQEGALKKTETLFENVQAMAEQNARIIEETFEILDEEAEEDEEYRKIFLEHDTWDRAPSHESNKELIEKLLRCKASLENASNSDKVVQRKWEEWEQTIEMLTMDEADLAAAVPQTVDTRTRSGTQTKVIARSIRGFLEELDNLRKARTTTITLAQRLAGSDRIQPRIVKEVSRLEPSVEVKPELFEDAIEDELQKYDRFRGDLLGNETKQDVLIKKIKDANDQLRQSRQDDASVKERERILQSLNLAYHNYQEVLSNLQEGLQFYNQLAVILNGLRNEAKQWVTQRREEVRWLTESLNSIPDNLPVASASNSASSAGRQTSTALEQPVEEMPPKVSESTQSWQPVHFQLPQTSTPIYLPPPTGPIQTQLEQLQISPPSQPLSQKALGKQPQSSVARGPVPSVEPPRSSPLNGNSQPANQQPIMPPAPWQQLKVAHDIPSLDSEEWEDSEELSPRKAPSRPAQMSGPSNGLQPSEIPAPWQQPKVAHDLPPFNSPEWEGVDPVPRSPPAPKKPSRRVVDQRLTNAKDWEDDDLPTPPTRTPINTPQKRVTRSAKKVPLASS